MVSISQERSLLKAVGLCDYRYREDWGARRSYTDVRTVIEPATRVFVHITVTNPENYSSFDRHAQAIESIGISRFPNTGMSYNRLIMAGTLLVYEGQPMGRRGAHTVNDKRIDPCSWFGSQCPGYKGPLSAPSWNLNYNARSYVYCANTWHSFDDNSLDTMARAIAADKLAGLMTKSAQIHGHRCVSWKSCPGDKVWARMHELESMVNFYLEGGDVALSRDQTTDAVWNNDGVIPNSSRDPKKDTNKFLTGATYLRRLQDRVVYPHSTDRLVTVIQKPILDRLDDLQRQIESTEIRLVEIGESNNAELLQLSSEHAELRAQLAAIQRILDSDKYLNWSELGEQAWADLPAWSQTFKEQQDAPSIATLKVAAHEGAKDALSEANLEVSWE